MSWVHSSPIHNSSYCSRRPVIPHFEFSTPFITAFVAILGTTISPYLFFWQASSEVDEMKAAGGATENERRGITRKELPAPRGPDVVVGMAFSSSRDVLDHP